MVALSEPGRTRRMLLVEDQPAVRKLISRHFTALGFEVDEAADGEQALGAASARPDGYDLVLSDVHLPNRSGLELAARLRARLPNQQVILFTGDSDRDLARAAMRRGVAGYLLKPFEMFELEAVVGQAIGHLELIEATAGRREEGVATRAA